MKLNIKLLITYVVIGATLLLLTGYYTQASLRKETFQSIQDGFIDQLYQVDFTITSLLEEVEYDVLDLTTNVIVRTGDDQDFTSFLDADEETFEYDYAETELAIIDIFNAYRINHPYANSVYMGRENGTFVRSHPWNRPTQYDPRQRPWYTLAAENPDEVMRTAPYQSVTIADVNIGTVKALVDDDGEVFGVVGVDITLRNLTEYIANIDVGEGGHIVLLDDNGTVLTGYDETIRFHRYDEVGLDYFQEVMDNETGYTVLEEWGESQYLFFYTSPALGWKICAVIPKQAIDLQVARFVYRVMGTLALSLFLLGLLTMVGVRRFIIKPIEHLEQNTQTIIRTGNLSHTVAVETRDEIGQLAMSFNEMVESIRKTEGDLRESEEKYRSLVQNLNVGIFRSTVESGGRLLHANPATARILGYDSVGELNNATLADLYQDSGERGRLIQRLEKGELLREYEVRLVRKDGQSIWASLSVTAQRDREGNLAWLEGVVEDITARKEAEEALLKAYDELEIKVRERTAELENANEELDAFAHTVAHDLKGPLSPLVGFSEMLERGAGSLEAGDLKESLHTIVQNARRMSSIIDELLLLASVRKQEEVELEPLDMAAIVAGAQKRLAYLLEEGEVEILLPDAWPRAVGYGPWIEEVWVNYISNAVKYGGQPPRMELGGEVQSDGQVRFWVRDNGRGLTPEEQEKVFIPFSRLDQVRARGYGLGLSIVQRIMTRLGGQVGVVSEIGQGSTFFFTLPQASD